MDLSGVRNLQFLDLSEVDEGEKNLVLSSLQLDQPDDKLPWFIGDERSTFKRTTQKSTKAGVLRHKQQSDNITHNASASITHIAAPLQNPFPNQQYYSELVNYNNVPYQSQPTNSKSIPIIDPSTGQQVVFNNYTTANILQQKSPVYYAPGTVAVTLISNVYPQATAIYNPNFYPNITPYTFPQVVPPYNTNTKNAYIAKPVNGGEIAGPIVESNTYPPAVIANAVVVTQAQLDLSSTNIGMPVPVESVDNMATAWSPNNFMKVPPLQAELDTVSVTDSNIGNNFITPASTPVDCPPANDTKHNKFAAWAGNNSAEVGEITKTSNTVLNSTSETQVVSGSPLESNYSFESKSLQNITVTSQSSNLTAQQDVNSTRSNGGVVKSWAGLFNSKKIQTGDEQIANGNAKNAFNSEAVNKESNNNTFNGNVCPIRNPRKTQFVDPDCYRMGEFLSTFALDGRATSLQPRGLINQSNYCYINSILQALIACPPVYNLLSGLSQNISSNEKRKPTPVIDGICRFIKEFKQLPASMRVSRRSDPKGQQKKDQSVHINTDIPFEPSWIYRMLNGLRTDLMEGRQEDAEEFLGCLLNNLNDEMLELIKLVKSDTASEDSPVKSTNHIDSDSEEKGWQVMGPKNKGSITRRTEFERTPISDIFGGFLKSRIHRTGDHITENIQPFFTLQLNIEKVKTVKEALEMLTTKYQLEGVTSSKTNEEVEAWQQVMLDELPVILVLHLKCFDFKLDGCTKIIKALEFPIDLKIDPKLLSSKTNSPKEKQYKLFAVVYHDGKEASKGHYVTDAFHVGYSSWLRYDDASVKPVQEDHVLKPLGTRVPYLLFYRRSDTIRSK